MNLELLEIFEDEAETEQRNRRRLYAERKAEERDNPGRYRRSDIGSKNDSDCLAQVYDFRIYETYDHDSRCSRRLNDCGNGHTCQHRREPVPGDFSQQRVQAVSGSLLNTVGKHLHTKKKKAERADKS